MLDKKKLFDELCEIARQRGGCCLSNESVNSSDKLLFKCGYGHEFESCRDYLTAGNWCPFCAGRGKNIQDMQAIAVARGGKCLSKEYVNSTTSLLWECQEGHQWDARPNNVLFGTWCPICARKNKKHKRLN